MSSRARSSCYVTLTASPRPHLAEGSSSTSRPMMPASGLRGPQSTRWIVNGGFEVLEAAKWGAPATRDEAKQRCALPRVQLVNHLPEHAHGAGGFRITVAVARVSWGEGGVGSAGLGHLPPPARRGAVGQRSLPPANLLSTRRAWQAETLPTYVQPPLLTPHPPAQVQRTPPVVHVNAAAAPPA